MTYEAIVGVLVAVGLGAMAFGMFNHGRLISKSGIRFTAPPDDGLDEAALRAKRRVFLGYGIAIAIVAICLAISIVSDPGRG